MKINFSLNENHDFIVSKDSQKDSQRTLINAPLALISLIGSACRGDFESKVEVLSSLGFHAHRHSSFKRGLVSILKNLHNPRGGLSGLSRQNGGLQSFILCFNH